MSSKYAEEVLAKYEAEEDKEKRQKLVKEAYDQLCFVADAEYQTLKSLGVKDHEIWNMSLDRINEFSDEILALREKLDRGDD